VDGLVQSAQLMMTNRMPVDDRQFNNQLGFMPEISTSAVGQKPDTAGVTSHAARDGSKARHLMFLPSYTEHMLKGPRTGTLKCNI